MATNNKTNKAREAKHDEFYTQLTDIENELKYYREYFRDKVVLCNCDDPRVSNFFRYFSYNFEAIGLKRLIATCYKNREPDLFSTNESEQACYIIYEGDKNGNKIPDQNEMEVRYLKGDGDFRSQECIELLKQADIVCTNPPFSLFREYIAQLFEYDKKFLLIGNTNSVAYTEIFPYIQQNRLWAGVTKYNSGMFFRIPDTYTTYHHIDEEGHKVGRVSTSCWWTNIENKRHSELFIPTKKYSEQAYPKYDNFDAIECGNYLDIPIDYKGIIGVPITFFGHYNPNQFEIVGEMVSTTITPYNFGYPYINGEKKYARLLIKWKQ